MCIPIEPQNLLGFSETLTVVSVALALSLGEHVYAAAISQLLKPDILIKSSDN